MDFKNLGKFEVFNHEDPRARSLTYLEVYLYCNVDKVIVGFIRKKFYKLFVMLNENTWSVKKCRANQKQHCKQAGVTKRFDIS